MSRDANGNYTLAAGNPPTSGSNITVTWAADTMNDLATEMNDSLSRSGKGGMSAGLKLAAGTVALPGLSWVTETSSGLYRVSAGVFGFAISGVQKIKFNSSGICTDVIAELTPAAGVTIDSVLLKDNTVLAGTLTLAAGSITDSSGAISFGNENLSTSGALLIDSVTGNASGSIVSADTGTATLNFGDQSNASAGYVRYDNTDNTLRFKAGGSEQIVISTTESVFAPAISVNDTTDSTSVTTGSIHTDGGLGVAKDVFVGGEINQRKSTDGALATFRQVGGSADNAGFFLSVDDTAKKMVLDFSGSSVGAWEVNFAFAAVTWLSVDVSLNATFAGSITNTGDLLTGSHTLTSIDPNYTYTEYNGGNITSTDWRAGFNSNSATGDYVIREHFTGIDALTIAKNTGNATFAGDVVVSGMLNLGSGSGLTISGGAVTVTASYHKIDTEAAGATDDLDTINGGVAGDTLIITSFNSARDVTVKDATGNLWLAGDFTLSTPEDTISFIYNGVVWLETSRSDTA